jgi:uncharacterized SAM-binding protein YcdF (DUF218 family)
VNRIRYVVTVHPYQDIQPGSEALSSQEKLKRRLGTETRCDALIEAYPQFAGQALIILTAGYSEHAPKHPLTGNPMSLADQQKEYLISRGIPAEVIIAEPTAQWGTVGEIVALIELLQNCFIVPEKLIVLTDVDHAKRARMIVEQLCIPEWHAEVRTSPRIMNLRQRVREWAARFRYKRRDIPEANWKLRYVRTYHIASQRYAALI